HRSLHRLHLEHLRHPGAAGALLCAGGGAAPLRASEACAGGAADLHRRQDFRRRPAGLGEVPGRMVAGDHGDDPGRGRRLIAVADPSSGSGMLCGLTMEGRLSCVVLFFVLGAAAALARSDPAMAEAIAKGMALFLVAAIGLKGGVEVAESGFGASKASAAA